MVRRFLLTPAPITPTPPTLTPPTVAAMGDLAGRVSRALDGFSHPGLDRILQWDLRYGEQVVTRLIAHAPRRREEILAAHDVALANDADGYDDPATGLFVFTATYLGTRDCCDLGCRHCPYCN